MPEIKACLQLQPAGLGALLLLLGLGSILTMPVSGALCGRLGAKRVIGLGGAAASLLLTHARAATGPTTLGAGLFVFGAAFGALDVAINIHAVEVDRAADSSVMSGFHALYSVGGILGARLLALSLSVRLAPVTSAACGSLIAAVALLRAWPRLLGIKPARARAALVLPRGVVLLLAAVAASVFLVEGAMLDWGALLAVENGLVAPSRGGVAYMAFSIGMTIGRLGGDRLATRVGDRRLLVSGGLLGVAGFTTMMRSPFAGVAVAGFLMIGLGMSNIAPILFRRAGAQKDMSLGGAIAAITTMGYGGVLLGPGRVGFVANAMGLRVAFWMLAALLSLTPLLARALTPSGDFRAAGDAS